MWSILLRFLKILFGSVHLFTRLKLHMTHSGRTDHIRWLTSHTPDDTQPCTIQLVTWWLKVFSKISSVNWLWFWNNENITQLPPTQPRDYFKRKTSKRVKTPQKTHKKMLFLKTSKHPGRFKNGLALEKPEDEVGPFCHHRQCGQKPTYGRGHFCIRCMLYCGPQKIYLV